MAIEAATGQVTFEASGLGPIQAPPLPYRGQLFVATLAGSYTGLQKCDATPPSTRLESLPGWRLD